MVAGYDGVTVLMGDLNSDAEADPGEPSYTDTYGNLVAAGFVDVWASAPHAHRANGYTCCQTDGNEPRRPDERIDFVLVRGEGFTSAPGQRRGHYFAEVVGTRRFDRTPSGLWPSDHGGIVASIRDVRLPQEIRY